MLLAAVALQTDQTQLNMIFFASLINVEMSTIVVGISTFMSRQNSILGLSEPENA